MDGLSGNLGPEHADTIATLTHLGETLQQAGRFVELEATLRRALEAQVKAIGEDNPATQRAIGMLENL